MGSINILVIGVLVVILTLAITMAIVALAPYIAGILSILGLCWLTLRKFKGT